MLHDLRFFETYGRQEYKQKYWSLDVNVQSVNHLGKKWQVYNIMKMFIKKKIYLIVV